MQEITEQLIINTNITEQQFLEALSSGDITNNQLSFVIDEEGLYNGATFTPSVSAMGDLSWVNDKELTNPSTINIKGPQGEQGSQGADGEAGPYYTPSVSASGEISWTNTGGLANPSTINIKGPQGTQGIQGAQGPQGEGFTIYKTYASIALMNADAANVEEGKFVMIASGVEDADNAKLYIKGTTSFDYISDLSGATGVKGDTGSQGIQGYTFTPSVNTDGIISWTNNGNLTNPNSVNIKGPQGADGAKGDPGDTEATFRRWDAS